MLGGRDPNGARRLFPKFTQRLELGLDFLQPRARGLKQAFAGFGWRDAACGAREQPKAEPLFDSTDGVTQCRLRHPELRSGPGEASSSRHRQERKEVIEGSARHL